MKTKFNILSRENLQDLREQAEGMASGNLNPTWARAYLALADAADHLDAMQARCEIPPPEGWKPGPVENIRTPTEE